ncbi:MAG: HRDC domain-containing protein [Thermodesulfobacteriota bacterium]|nr:HRDC domain-containing protein [Thermodesulfobacteriota bacterium]
MGIIELKNDNEVYEYLNKLDERNQKIIALDIEAEFNLHCYGEHLCLIQIFDQENEIIIDPFKFKDRDSIKKLLEKRDLLKIMYDSLSDAALLENEYNIRLKAVLDLRPAVTLLEHPKQSLAHVLDEELGIVPVNKKKFQRHNWMKRPINKDAIEYAMGDVRYLFRLKDALFDKLKNNGLLDTYILHNLMIQDGTSHKNKKAKHEKAKGYYRLDKRQQEIFKEIFTLRDAFAKRINKPPNYVFSNIKLLDLCKKNIQDPNFVKQGINHKIEHSIRDEIFDRFTAIVQGRSKISDSVSSQ